MTDYELPAESEISARFRHMIRYWRGRNKYIRDVRKALNGNNEIEMPRSMHYKVRVVHSYVLATLINEKVARYLQRPRIQVIPEDDIDSEGRAKSSRIEVGINKANYEMERMGEGDVWRRAIIDAHLLDEGVTKTLNMSKVLWSELVENDTKVLIEAGENKYPTGSKSREQLKKSLGIPFNRFYVPLENFLPRYDGPKMKEAFEIQERTLLDILEHPLFKGAEALKTLPTPGPDGGISQTVNIVEMANDYCHAYYIAGPGPNSGRSWPKITPGTVNFSGELKYLYHYEHGIGRSIYNPFGGRFGGWKTDNNRIEGIGKALLELSQTVDEILSQVLTNTRAKYWPTLKFTVDPELRGYGAGGTKPDAPQIKEGEPLVMFKGEEIEPIFQPKEDPMVMWLYDKVMEQISKMGGAAALFGGREPGVDTGYHQALQTTQAEDIDEAIEQNITMGAEQDATIFMLYVKGIGEKVWSHYKEPDPKIKGRKVGKYVCVDPDDLTPLPFLDAQVRKPRPIDYISALRAAREASDDRGGKGPLLSDDSIRQDILALEAPDTEEDKIMIEVQKREVIASGIISSKIGEMINIKMARQSIPDISPEMLQKVDPALLAAMANAQPSAAAQGGTDPRLLGMQAQQVSGGGGGLPPGPVPGDPEENNRLGEAIAGASLTGTSSI